jgi:hypothetical protein
MSGVTQQDIHDINYFYFQRDDLERWCDWEKKKEEIRKSHPEVVDAYERLVSAKATFEILIKNMEVKNDNAKKI